MTKRHPILAEAMARYIDRTIALNTSIAAGLGDSEEADGVRDELDVIWRALSDFEQRIARRVSAALNRSAAAEKLAEAVRQTLIAWRHGGFHESRDDFDSCAKSLKSALAEYEGEGGC